MKFHGTITVVEDEVLSVDDAAVWLKVDVVTVQWLLREGRLAAKLAPVSCASRLMLLRPM